MAEVEAVGITPTLPACLCSKRSLGESDMDRIIGQYSVESSETVESKMREFAVGYVLAIYGA